AKQLGEGGVVLSTDDFFMRDGKYYYDPSLIGKAHNWNQQRAYRAIEQGISPIVIDNTNVQAWEPRPYVAAGRAAGYQIRVVEPDTEWKFDPEELANRNTHGVPLEAIQKMINRWDHDITPDDIMKSEKPKKF
ncbi:MAG: hypothetical protein CUN56_16310, partial [Phototrophicales bacterium]